MARIAWPSREAMAGLLDEHGAVAAVARHLGHSPNATAQVIRKYRLDYDLHQAGMPECDVKFGWDAEDHAAGLLHATVLRKGDVRYAKHDLNWNGVRVNVKAAHPTRAGTRGVGLGWSFNVKRGRGHCDVFFCIGYSDATDPLRYVLIPAEVLPTTTLRIPLTFQTKWAVYEWTPD